jgi:hypothetical protein
MYLQKHEFASLSLPSCFGFPALYWIMLLVATLTENALCARNTSCIVGTVCKQTGLADAMGMSDASEASHGDRVDAQYFA